MLDGDSSTTFIDGSLMLQGGQQEGANFQPWIEGGMRHLLGDRGSQAVAGFVGAGQIFTLPGVLRDKTVGVVGAGASVDLRRSVRLYGSYRAELGDGQSHNVNVGVRMRF